MILNFFGTTITVSTIDHNYDYANFYRATLNRHLKNGYVPLSRILYFYVENDLLSFDEIYLMNQNEEYKKMRSIDIVCQNEKVKNMAACVQSNIDDNREYLEVPEQYFNFPLVTDYIITSFFNEEREVFGQFNNHHGWDFATAEKSPVYSVCSGEVIDVNYTQDDNVPYNESGNAVGNTITIECQDYGDKYYVIFAHLYPNSAKVTVGDKVNHWTEIASVGTTGHSTGNHLHYEVRTSDGIPIDGMIFIDMQKKF